MQRCLATIMAADVVGYSRLMAEAEEATCAQLEKCQSLISETVNAGGGRVFSRAGDAAFAEFESPINAVRSAVTIREELAGLESDKNGELQLRFGLHLADVVVSGDDLLGDGVNITARIQQNADPDAICVSHSLFEQIKRHSPFAFEDLGEHQFKNLPEAVRVYRLKGHLPNHRLQSAPTQRLTAQREAIEPNTVAVLPFVSAARDGDDRYLAEGLTEEIIFELARFQKLRVTSRSASFIYVDKIVDPTEVAGELGVNYTLAGQVRRLGKKVRLSLELTNGQTGIAVWSDRMTCEFDDLFELMDEVTTHVAATILGRVEADAIETARKKPPENMTAYDLLLRGLDHHRVAGVTNENARQAVDWFDRSIEADPTYGPAYAWRICAASWLPEFDLEVDRRFIDRALELDPNDPETQRIMGTVQMISGDFEASRYHHERAMERSPCDAYIMARSAAFYTFNGEPEVALDILEKAIRLDPLLPVWCIEERGIALFGKGDLEEALVALNELPFQTYRSRLYQCATLVELGRTAEAKVAMQQALAINSELTAMGFMRKECWRDLSRRNRIKSSLVKMGLPRK
ncbi:MAG: adenylate/guanylate cyclase domain-containing protein [Hyphomicrobiales bacterium]